MREEPKGKLTKRDESVSRVLDFLPWLAFAIAAIPWPVIFLLLYFASAATDTAALYLFLSLISFGVGFLVGLGAVVILLLYRKNWLKRLRDKLAADGITASEVRWFLPELTSTERKSLDEIRGQNLLLADAYLETLASRLTATRIMARASRELVTIERRLNRARSLTGVDTADLLGDLQSDRERYRQLKEKANARLNETKARLQTIEAAAGRNLNEGETDQMLSRLTAAQEQLPLVLEMSKLEGTRDHTNLEKREQPDPQH